VPESKPLPDPAQGELVLSVPSATGIYRRRLVDLDAMEADERAADVHLRRPADVARAALDAAGVRVTLLRYCAMNPL